MIGGFSKFLGINYGGNEKEALSLFHNIEERRRARVAVVERGVGGVSNGFQ